MLAGFQFRRHALERALDMGLEPETIRDLLDRPDIVREHKSPKHGACWQFRKGGLAALAARHGDTYWVITIIPATEEEWRRRYPSGKAPDGREFRPDAW